MGLDVIDHGRGLATHGAFGMHQQELSAGLPPPVIVTTLRSGRAVRIMPTVASAGAGDLTGAALAVGNNTATGADMGRAGHQLPPCLVIDSAPLIMVPPVTTSP